MYEEPQHENHSCPPRFSRCDHCDRGLPAFFCAKDPAYRPDQHGHDPRRLPEQHKTTPNIDAVAAEAVRFEQAIAPIPLTLPSHSTMLTGTIPPYHGIHDNLNYMLADSNLTLAEMLKASGYTTGGIISSYVLEDGFGLGQGFDTYDDEFDEIDNQLGAERRGGEVSAHAIKWLDENRDEDFFLFLHYYDPHSPYDPPEPYRGLFGSIAAAEAIGLTDNTSLTADTDEKN
ncbi:MAG: sulfatase-like hydrolase/transferase [Planctomycetota bacterium]